MGALIMAGKVHADEGQLAAAAAGDEDAVIGSAEMGGETGLGDPDRITAGNADAVDALVFRPVFRCEEAAAVFFIDDGAPVRGEGRAAIMARFRGQCAGAAARGCHRADAAEILVVPGGVDDAAAVT